MSVCEPFIRGKRGDKNLRASEPEQLKGLSPSHSLSLSNAKQLYSMPMCNRHTRSKQYMKKKYHLEIFINDIKYRTLWLLWI